MDIILCKESCIIIMRGSNIKNSVIKFNLTAQLNDLVT